jgi:endonuclease-3
MTVLSQHTSDANSERAFASLRRRFPRWEQVVKVAVEEVAEAIRAGGLANQKAPRLQAILAEVERREGRLSLARLRCLDDDEALAYLCSLPGVGPKTAACVLLFSLGRAAFPVDTHVHRLALRLGWVVPGTSAEAAQRVLTPRVPSELRYELHSLLIAHGRTVCSARSPRCSDCVLLDLCPTGTELLAREPVATRGSK